MADAGRMPIAVVPHFMRLHEWIAMEEGYFTAEGLEPALREDVMHAVSSHRGDPYKSRPQDRPFADQAEVANSACHWGSVCNAAAGMGKFVPDVYGVANFGIYVRPDSPIRSVDDLRDVPIGVGIMAGSHFTTLEALERHLPPEAIKVEYVGGPGSRLLALEEGRVEAANLLAPEIFIAEQQGLRRVIGGEFKTLFWVSATLPREVLVRYFAALRRADRALRADPTRYLPLWERNVPPALRDHEYDVERFGPGELLVFERYPEDEFERTVAFARKWGLDGEMVETSYDQLIASVA
jgi:ABC-type nitrate/sulfonate/bicarbonate transport system substrate-binding protein